MVTVEPNHKIRSNPSNSMHPSLSKRYVRFEPNPRHRHKDNGEFTDHPKREGLKQEMEGMILRYLTEVMRVPLTTDPDPKKGLDTGSLPACQGQVPSPFTTKV